MSDLSANQRATCSSSSRQEHEEIIFFQCRAMSVRPGLMCERARVVPGGGSAFSLRDRVMSVRNIIIYVPARVFLVRDRVMLLWATVVPIRAKIISINVWEMSVRRARENPVRINGVSTREALMLVMAKVMLVMDQLLSVRIRADPKSQGKAVKGHGNIGISRGSVRKSRGGADIAHKIPCNVGEGQGNIGEGKVYVSNTGKGQGNVDK